jgi:AcrR family transcriptional regulator
MQVVKPAKKRGAGRPARISRATIAAAALKIVNAEGVAGLTMRRVAHILGVAPMATYRHVRDKDELLVLLLDSVYRERRTPRFPTEPRKRLTAIWKFLHSGLERYPWIVQALVRSDVIAPPVLEQMEDALGCLVACGLTHEEAGDAYRILWQFTVGEVMLRARMLRREHSAKPSGVVRTLLDVNPSDMPHLARVAQYWFAPPKSLAYEQALRRLLGGLLPDPRSLPREHKT